MGFLVQKIKGFGRKREMVIAHFKEPLSQNKKLRSTPWHISTLTHHKIKKAIVLGAGLAGCYTANALAKRGWQVILLDQNNEVGQGASGNTQAVLYPKLSSYRSPLTYSCWLLIYSLAVFITIISESPIGDLSGILQLALNEKEIQSQVVGPMA